MDVHYLPPDPRTTLHPLLLSYVRDIMNVVGKGYTPPSITCTRALLLSSMGTVIGCLRIRSKEQVWKTDYVGNNILKQATESEMYFMKRVLLFLCVDLRKLEPTTVLYTFGTVQRQLKTAIFEGQRISSESLH